MDKYTLSKKEGTFIIFDTEGRLQYPNIDDKNLKYIERNRQQIKKELVDNNIVIIKNYIIKIESLDLDFRKYFFANFYSIKSSNSNELISMAYTDKVTGLYNKNLWNKIKQNIMSPIKTDMYSMMTISINPSIELEKNINNITNIIKDKLSLVDIAIRSEKNEFIIILPNNNIEKSKDILHSIENKLKEKFNIKIKISHTKNKEELQEIHEKDIKKINNDRKNNQIDYFKNIEIKLSNIANIVENIEDVNVKSNIKKELVDIINLISEKSYKN
ncbi:hypothetical protein [Senegalia massiliensis]|uniref:Diguanylate cyclase n=1 Tax=Senegalia massiliensis TaxID=1720316 RepID=A0A845QXV3_9CLOT|nr:hypothetical protein [Senegalia massiliensis]NBI06336.1 diguanylate cyclase [Senegalia massiliensis]